MKHFSADNTCIIMRAVSTKKDCRNEQQSVKRYSAELSDVSSSELSARKLSVSTKLSAVLIASQLQALAS